MSTNGQMIPLSALRGRVAETEEELRACEDEIGALNARKQLLLHKLETLRSLEPLASDAPSGERRSMGPKAAMLQYIRDNPGRRPVEVIDALLSDETIESKAKDKKRNLYATLYGIRKRGELIVQRSRRLYLRQEGGE